MIEHELVITFSLLGIDFLIFVVHRFIQEHNLIIIQKIYTPFPAVEKKL